MTARKVETRYVERRKSDGRYWVGFSRTGKSLSFGPKITDAITHLRRPALPQKKGCEIVPVRVTTTIEIIGE